MRGFEGQLFGAVGNCLGLLGVGGVWGCSGQSGAV